MKELYNEREGGIGIFINQDDPNFVKLLNEIIIIILEINPIWFTMLYN